MHLTGCSSTLTNERLDTIEAVVDCYIHCQRPRAEKERAFYAASSSLKEVIKRAAEAIPPPFFKMKRHPHQRRLSKKTLGSVYERLKNTNWTQKNTLNFDRLHEIIHEEISDVYGVGPLMIYDTTLRISAYFGIEPDKIYLHCGARAGARAIGIDQLKCSTSSFPKPLQKLCAREIEDCLCIYKQDLKRLRESRDAKD